MRFSPSALDTPEKMKKFAQLTRAYLLSGGFFVQYNILDTETLRDAQRHPERYRYVRRDQRYYDASGGGVTIGGGEASCYPEFCLALIEKCHAAGIRAAIDTCGYTVSPRSLDALKAADLLLFDLKGIDPDLHEKNTGVRNERILENLRTLSAMGKPIIIRIPVITGYNDSDAELDGMIALLRECRSVERVDLIPVHEFGKVKYRQIGLPYTLHAAPISPERQQALKKKFEDAGFCTQIGG